MSVLTLVKSLQGMPGHFVASRKSGERAVLWEDGSIVWYKHEDFPGILVTQKYEFDMEKVKITAE